MRKILLLLAIALTLASITSCTYFRPNKDKIQARITERARELTSGARVSAEEAKKHVAAAQVILKTANVPTNATSPVTMTKPLFNAASNEVDQASEALDVTGSLLRRDENLMGKPIVDQTPVIMKLLSENKSIRESAEVRERSREKQEEAWRAKEAVLEAKLVEYGTKYEQERNDRITSWVKWGAIALLAIGGPIALCVLFPPFASFLVGIFPALGSIFGVPASFAKNMVKGVGNTKDELSKQIAFNVEAAARSDTYIPKTYTPEEVMALLNSHLSTSLDTRDKTIVSHYKVSQNV